MAIPGNLLSETTSSIEPNTSGWRPRLNCTIFTGTGGRVGARTLGMDATVSGEMQAETVSTYPVVSGEVYQCFADAAGTQAERMGIEWLSAAGAQVGLTWSMTTIIASSSLHRVGVAGECPLGATRARLVLSATAAGAGADHFWENLYLGLPIRTTGNLLSFNVESGGELSTAGWVAEANTVLERRVPVFQWPADLYLGGGHATVAAVVANGSASLLTADRPPVTPGVEYLGYAYLAPPTTGSQAWVELRFYDAADALLGSTRAVLAAMGTGFARQYVSAVAPAGAASCALAVGLTGATAGQRLVTEGVVVQAHPVLHDGNLVPYADATFEQGVGSWTVASGPAAIARSTPWGAVALDSAYSLRVTSATAATSVLRSGPIPLGPGGQQWRLRVGQRIAAGSWDWVRRIEWYDADGVLLDVFESASTPMPTPAWWNNTSSMTAPSGAVSAVVELALTPAAGGAELNLDLVLLWRDVPESEGNPDPGTASITVILRELVVGRVMTLYRVGEDGQRTLVRGTGGMMDRVLIEQDMLLVEDYEAPLGVPVRYRAEFHDAVGVFVGNRDTDPVTLDPGDRNEAWLKDTARPHRNIRVMVQRAPDWSRPVEQSAIRVRGRRNAIVLSDVRGGLEGQLTVWTRDDEERHRLHWLLDSGHILLWQAAPGMGVEDVYVQVGEATEARVTGYAPEPWRAWTLPLVQVDKPLASGVAGTAGRSWQDVLATHATWQQVRDRYAMWEDVLLDRPIGGGG